MAAPPSAVLTPSIPAIGGPKYLRENIVRGEWSVGTLVQWTADAMSESVRVNERIIGKKSKGLALGISGIAVLVLSVMLGQGPEPD